MAYIHGQEIAAREVEREISNYGAERFASLCNTIVWSSTAETKSPIPSLTENTSRPDGGIDGEWDSELAGDFKETQLLKKGWNVFQYKQRDIAKDDKKTIFSKLKTDLKGEAEKLYKRTKKLVNNYVLFVNLDLSHETDAENSAEAQVRSLKDAIIEGYTGGNDVNVQIIGGAEIASFLNNNPHVRAAYFGVEIFKNWQTLSNEHRKNYPNAPIDYIGREDDLTKTIAYVNDPDIRCIVLAGPPGIGKTRLALEATKEQTLHTIAPVDSISLTTEKLLTAIHPHKKITIIIEDPDEDKIDNMVKEMINRENVKLIITLPTTTKGPLLNLSLMKRIKSQVLSPLDENEATNLLKQSKIALDYGLKTYIVSQSGGNPGILLEALDAQADLKKRDISFFDAIANNHKAQIKRRLGGNALDLIRPLAIMTFVGVKAEAKKELEQITQLFGLNNYAEILNKLDELKGAGVINIKGDFAEVQPPLLANKLASEVFSGKHKEIAKALRILNEKQALRLVRRLQNIPPEEIKEVWDYFYGENGPFSSFDTAIQNIALLRQVAFSEPEKTLNLFKAGLKAKGENFGEKSRNDLKWAIEDLLFVKETSREAMILMAHLAQNETQNGIGNNSEGVFAGCFWPHHPQFPLELNERLKVLEEVIKKENSDDMRLLGVKAIEETTERHGSIALKPSSGSRLVGIRPTILNRDVWSYLDRTTDIAIELSKNDKSSVGDEARKILPSVISDYVLQVPLEDGLKKCKILTDWVLGDEVEISTAKWSSQLAYIKQVISGHLKTAKNKGQEEMLSKFVDEIDELKKKIESESSYSTRLKRWAGSWGFGDHEFVGKEEKVRRSDFELEKLAEETIKNKELLSDELIAWLLTTDAQKAHAFFVLLGQKDKGRILLDKMNKIGEDENGARVAFSSYYGGFATVDYDNFEQKLIESSKNEEIKSIGLFYGIAYLEDGALGLKLVGELAKLGQLEPSITTNVLGYSSWFKSLSEEGFKQFLIITAGKNVENAEYVIQLAHTWVHGGKEIPESAEDIIWQCLKKLPELKLDTTAYDFNQIASRLAKKNTEEAFRLLKILLAQPYSNRSWKLFDFGAEREAFWDVACEIDAKRCLEMVYEVVVKNEMTDASFKIREIIDSFNAEYLINFAKASPENAKFIANNLTGKHAEYWFIASEILNQYPSDAELEKELYYSAQMSSGVGVFSGPYSASIRSKAKQLDRFKDDPKLSDLVKGWIKKFQEESYKQADTEELREENRDIDYL